MTQIKLTDYALISVKELDERIKILKISLKTDKLENSLHQSLKEVRIEGEFLEYLKQSLIPSEKLAEVAFDKGCSHGYDVANTDSNEEVYYTVDKQDFLNNNIEIN